MTDASQTDRQLKLLTSQREYVFRDIQILYDLSKNIQTDKAIASQFKARVKRIESVRMEFLI